MKSTIIISGLLAAVLAASCYDDKGNYDYTDINRTEVGNIEKSYNKTSFEDTLFIRPKVTSTFPDASYDYLWTLTPAYKSVPTGGRIDADTIGTEAELAYPVTLKKGTYDIVLKLTDRQTGYATFHSTQMLVTTEFSNGFYILKEVDGNTEVDFHKPDGSVAGNLLEKNIGAALPGKPTSMGLIFAYSHIDPETNKYIDPAPPALSVCAGNDIRVFNLTSMAEMFSYETLFWDHVPANEKPLYICPGMFGINYFSTGGCYFNYQAPVWGINSVGKFGLPTAVGKGCSPNINCIYASSNYYIYDELNNRFLSIDFNGGLHNYEQEENANNLPESYELLFFGSHSLAGNYNGFALFKDTEDQGKHYLYTLQFGDEEKPLVEDITEIPQTSKLDNATKYAMNERDARFIYFVTDGQLYIYDIEKATEEPVTLAGFAQGEEITYLSNRYWISEADKENNFNYLAIATANGGEYKIHLYDLLGGKPVGAPVRILKGEGKAVKMHFLSPYMEDSMSDLDATPGTF